MTVVLMELRNYLKRRLHKYIKNKCNAGKGISISKGTEAATKRNIILIDGDLEIELSEINKLTEKFESYDFQCAIVGVRWKKFNFNNLKIFDIGNYIINLFFNILFNSKANDILCCLKIIPKSLIDDFKLTSRGFSIETEIMSKLVLNKDNI